MKQVKEFIGDTPNNYPWMTAVVMICIVVGILQMSGFITWHHELTESFWKYKHL